MPRLMSFAKTVDVFDRKDVTRRDGWLFLRPGEVVQCVDRSPRLGNGYRVLGLRRVVSVRRERLGAITPAEVEREGFLQLSPSGFVELYCAPKPPDPDRMVTRIELALVEGGER